MEEQSNQSETTVAPSAQTIIIEHKEPNKNSLGTAGFIFAIIGLFTGWIPVIGWIIWALGAIFSIIGLFRTPKGLAIAGFIISFIGLIILIVVIGAIGAAGGAAALLG